MLALLPHVAAAQTAGGARAELRLETIAARRTTVQAGAGFNAMAGPYVRWGLVVAGGATRTHDLLAATWRADAVVRFVLDPFRESRRGLYGLAGVSAMDDGSGTWEPRVLVGVGIEGRAHGRAIPSLELALGGGVRVAAVVRRTRHNRR